MPQRPIAFQMLEVHNFLESRKVLSKISFFGKAFFLKENFLVEISVILWL